jgi:hypothetical protein
MIIRSASEHQTVVKHLAERLSAVSERIESLKEDIEIVEEDPTDDAADPVSYHKNLSELMGLEAEHGYLTRTIQRIRIRPGRVYPYRT